MACWEVPGHWNETCPQEKAMIGDGQGTSLKGPVTTALKRHDALRLLLRFCWSLSGVARGLPICPPRHCPPLPVTTDRGPLPMGGLFFLLTETVSDVLVSAHSTPSRYTTVQSHCRELSAGLRLAHHTDRTRSDAGPAEGLGVCQRSLNARPRGT